MSTLDILIAANALLAAALLTCRVLLFTHRKGATSGKAAARHEFAASLRTLRAMDIVLEMSLDESMFITRNGNAIYAKHADAATAIDLTFALLYSGKKAQR